MYAMQTLGKPTPARRWPRVLVCGLWSGLLAVPALAQPSANLLVNAGFEDNPPPAQCGNHYPWLLISPWVMLSGNQTNIIAVDGGTLCNYGISGPAVDAENTPAGTWQHYLDLLADGTVYQAFTVPSCPGGGTAPRTATFSGYFSSRDGSSAGFGRLSIVSGTGGGGTVLASASTAPGSLSYRSWTQVGNSVSLTPGATVSYVVYMTNPTNFDNASVTLSACPVPAPTAVPANEPWALLLAAVGVGWLARRRVVREQRSG